MSKTNNTQTQGVELIDYAVLKATFQKTLGVKFAYKDGFYTYESRNGYLRFNETGIAYFDTVIRIVRVFFPEVGTQYKMDDIDTIIGVASSNL